MTDIKRLLWTGSARKASSEISSDGTRTDPRRTRNARWDCRGISRKRGPELRHSGRRAWAYRDQASHFRHTKTTPRASGGQSNGCQRLCACRGTSRPPPFGRLIDRHRSHESDKVHAGDGIQPVSGQRHKRPYGVAPVRPFGCEEAVGYGSDSAGDGGR